MREITLALARIRKNNAKKLRDRVITTRKSVSAALQQATLLAAPALVPAYLVFSDLSAFLCNTRRYSFVVDVHTHSYCMQMRINVDDRKLKGKQITRLKGFE